MLNNNIEVIFFYTVMSMKNQSALMQFFLVNFN